MDRRNAMILGAGAALGGLPAMRPDQRTDVPPSGIVPGARGAVILAKRVIIGGTGTASGLFDYTPAQGAGNLVAAIVPVQGFDAKGNAVLAGIAGYQAGSAGAVGAVQLIGGNLSFYTAPSEAGPYTRQALIGGAGVANTLQLFGGVGGQVQVPSQLLAAGAGLSVTGGETADTVVVSSGQANAVLVLIQNTTAAPAQALTRWVTQTAGDRTLAIRVVTDTNTRWSVDSNGLIQWGTGLIAPDCALYRAAANQLAADYLAFNNGGAAETWQTVGGTGAAFAGTWANAASPGVPLQYRRNSAPYKSVHWVGRVTNTVAQAAGSAITAAVPVIYRPAANTHDITCFNLTSGAVVRVSIGATGILTCQSAVAANDIVTIPDTSVGIDA